MVHTRADLVPVEHPLRGTPLPSVPAIAAIMTGWSKKAEAALGEVIGHTRTGITRADIMTTWPFNNEIVLADLTGQQLLENLHCCGGAAPGLTYRRSGDQVVATLDGGRALDPAVTYRVLANSYMYAGGDHYLFRTQNPNGYSLGVPMQKPVIHWIQAHKTSPQHPLETRLQGRPQLPR